MRQAGETIQAGERSYVIERMQARGAFGTTYLARDVASEQAVAFKEIDIRDLESWKTFELFEREVEALRRIDHPRVPRYEDAFICQGDRAVTREAATGAVSFVLVQGYVHGTSLAERLRAREPLTSAETERLLSSLLEVLDYLHRLAPPIVHRDIKPSNIILDERGEPHLVDFGSVRDTLTAGADSMGSTVAGTLGYMPPEQAMGKARPASDLYSLAMTVLVAATGKEPSALVVDDSAAKVRVPSSTFTPAVARALGAMLEPSVGRRPASVAEVRKLLARPAGVSRPVVATTIAVALVAGLGAGLFVLDADPTTSSAHASVTKGPTGWFSRMRPHCNPVEVDVAIRKDPPGPSLVDQSDAAACLAIAGKIDRAKAVLDAIPKGSQPEAANRLFTLIHPIADQGDDASTGPIMRLVLDYTPNNYMALYHAGVAEYAMGDRASATTHLQRFLELYRQDDGWTRSARRVLSDLESATPTKCGEALMMSPEGRPIRAPACK